MRSKNLELDSFEIEEVLQIRRQFILDVIRLTCDVTLKHCELTILFVIFACNDSMLFGIRAVSLELGNVGVRFKGS